VSGQFGQRDFRLVSTELAPQVRQALQNVSDILATFGASMSDVVKTTVYLADLEHFDEMNRVYLEHFALDSLPARTTAGASLPFGALVEIEAWACVE
jgi:2-iminobutanoate/2-iminopropanoate deaminase